MAQQQKLILSVEEQANADAMITKGTYKGAYGTTAQGLIWNSHKDNKNLELYDKRDWSQRSITFYPFRMLPSTLGQGNYIGHQAPLPVGGKGAAVYTDGKGPTARKWLVAYDSLLNKIYVEAGPIGPTNWSDIENKLNNSGSVSEYEDPIFHGKAEAEIFPKINTSILFVRFT
ncbi:uncharacterized protein LOC141646271 [Silene latifolia]|uniref:uncharacterized protein LOC141646271 n=1 Tax=Silene latifolia TaxID=37657 RepID=UPI003D7838A9